MSLARLGEFGLIDRIRAAVRDDQDVLVGIGDDCSAVRVPDGELLLTTTDLLIEGVHFRRDWTDLTCLGRKSVTVNVSDIAAMGGTPRQLYLGLALPPALAEAEFDALMRGVLAAATDYGATLAGGDTCRSSGPLLIAVTAQGSVLPERLVRRSGAQVGDDIYVSGTLGDSALALHQLLAGATPHPELARRHHDPLARVALGQRLGAERLASAMIDLSDGLISDLGHILDASGVGARVAAAQLPLSAPFRAGLAEGAGALSLALGGGEDYELLFTAPSGAQPDLERLAAELALPLTCVGEIVAHPGLVVYDAHGAVLPLHHNGYNHFR